jgi:hypothetical protein
VAAAADYGVSAIVIVYRLKQLKLASEARIGRLEREIEDGLHAYLPYAPRDDGLATIGALPYLSPRLDDSLLAAALRKEAAIDAATAGAVDRITRPGLP